MIKIYENNEKCEILVGNTNITSLVTGYELQSSCDSVNIKLNMDIPKELIDVKVEKS